MSQFTHSIRDTSVETINSKRSKVSDSTACLENLENGTSKRFSDWSSHLQIGQIGRLDGTYILA